MAQNPVNSEIPQAKSPGNVAVKLGYGAIKNRYDYTDSAGTNVSVYPDGTVIDRDSGEFLKGEGSISHQILQLLRQQVRMNASWNQGTDGTKTGTGVTQVSTVSIPIREVIIRPLPTNTGAVYVGLSSSVSSTIGGWVLPTATSAPIRIPVNDLNLIFISPAVGGEGIGYTYII